MALTTSLAVDITATSLNCGQLPSSKLCIMADRLWVGTKIIFQWKKRDVQTQATFIFSVSTESIAVAIKRAIKRDVIDVHFRFQVFDVCSVDGGGSVYKTGSDWSVWWVVVFQTSAWPSSASYHPHRPGKLSSVLYPCLKHFLALILVF